MESSRTCPELAFCLRLNKHSTPSSRASIKLDLLQYVSVLFPLGSPRLDPGLRMWSDKSHRGRNNHSGYTLANTA